MEQVARKGRVLFVNDSKATNADAAARALASFSDIFWIAGGKQKTGGIASLDRLLSPHPQGLPDRRGGGRVRPARSRAMSRYEVAGTLDKAVAQAARDAESAAGHEPVVLLSPACASFDQYPNFEVRGAAFRDLVLSLPGVTPVS